jgi:hypothetical protein
VVLPVTLKPVGAEWSVYAGEAPRSTPRYASVRIRIFRIVL